MNPTNTTRKPIWLSPVEAQLDFDELVEKVRSELANSRGKLHDIAEMYRGWHERVDFAAGGLTCVISALYPGMVEYREFRERREAKIREGDSVPNATESR